MKRDKSLIPLSQQHHNGLALCVLIGRSLREDGTGADLAGLARRIVDRYEIELVNHFSMEEKILFPACPDALSALVAELTEEHREMERMVEQLRSNATVELITAFTELLRRHIRREENELFQQAQEQIPREHLDSLGLQIEKNAVHVCL